MIIIISIIIIISYEQYTSRYTHTYMYMYVHALFYYVAYVRPILKVVVKAHYTTSQYRTIKAE